MPPPRLGSPRSSPRDQWEFQSQLVEAAANGLSSVAVSFQATANLARGRDIPAPEADGRGNHPAALQIWQKPLALVSPRADRTLLISAGFSVLYLEEPLGWNQALGFALIAGGAFFVFQKW